MPDQAFVPEVEIVKGTKTKKKKSKYQDVLKNMISRLEMEGTLAQRKEIGRTEKGHKFN